MVGGAVRPELGLGLGLLGPGLGVKAFEATSDQDSLTAPLREARMNDGCTHPNTQKADQDLPTTPFKDTDRTAVPHIQTPKRQIRTLL